MNNQTQNGTGRQDGMGNVGGDRGMPRPIETAKRGRAKTRADVAKRWQTVTIFAIGRTLKTDVNKLCADFYLCRPSELGRGAADEFIDRLKRLRPAQA